MPGIGIIANPHSKLNKRNPGRQQLLGYILGERGQLAVTNTLEQLSTVAKEFRDREISILAINGGDGTISRTLTAFIQHYGTKPLPQIVLLRGGTINVLANNLGIRGRPEEVLFRLLEAHSGGRVFRTQRIKTLCVDGHYGFLFGNGTAAAFLKVFYQNKTGPLGAMLLVARLYLAALMNRAFYETVVASHEMSLQADGKEPIAHKSISVLCSTLVKAPLGIPVFPKARRSGCSFQAISFVLKPESVPWQLPLAILRPGEGEAFGKLSFCANQLTVRAGTARLYTVDGELYEAATDTMVINPGPELEFVIV